MMSRAAVGMLLALVAGIASAAEPQAAAEPQVLVRVLELSGTGPGDTKVMLLKEPDGVQLPLPEIGRIGERVDGRGLAGGTYHTLTVKLADRYVVRDAGGAEVVRRFDVTPAEMRIPGMLLVRDGKAVPMRMHEPPRRYRGERRRGHDDDD